LNSIIKRVSITGPESTGKTDLARQLANHYQTLWVPEVARDYLSHLDKPYALEDISRIAKKQLEIENNIASTADRLLFCDTDLLVTKVWSNWKYGKCDPWIDQAVRDHRYDLYLLCNIDLSWEQDPLREHPDKREELFNQYLIELHQLKVNYKIISGLGDTRLKHAIFAVEKAFKLNV